MFNKDLIFNFQKDHKKTEFDLDSAVEFALKSVKIKYNDGQKKKLRILVNSVQRKYAKYYKDHHYIQARVDADQKVQTFLDKEFVFPVSEIFYLYFVDVRYKQTRELFFVVHFSCLFQTSRITYTKMITHTDMYIIMHMNQ